MPNWKKLIVSGSDANLNSLNITTDLTGSNALITNDLDVLGKVGIGTTTPGEKLELAGTGELSLKINNTQYTRSLSITQGGGYSHLTTSHSSGVAINYGQGNAGILSLFNNTTQAVKINANGSSYLNGGNVGIGTTSPSTKLEISASGVNGVDISQSASNASQSGRLFFTTNTASEGFALFNANGTLQINSGGIPNDTSGTNRISIIGSSGNVGINTTSPDFKLDVDGTFGVSGIPLNTDSTFALVADEILGSQLIPNGNFATNSNWNLGAGQWTITGGAAVASNAGNILHTAAAVASSTGIVHKVIFTLSDVTGGYVKVGLSNLETTQYNTNGTYTVYTESSGNNYLYFHPYGFTGKVSNVSTYEVANNQIQKRELGTGAFGPTPVGAFLPLAGGTMTGDLELNDNVVLKFGNSDDLRIQHASGGGGVGYIQNYTGDLQIQNRAADKDILFRADDGTGTTVATYMFLDGSQTNVNFQKDAIWADNKKALFGGSGDLQIYHDGSNSYINEVGTGDLYLQTNGTNMFLRDSASGNTFISMNVGTANVSLKQGGNTKLTTTSTGVDVTGDLTVTGKVTAQEFHTEFVSASIMYDSGSTKFGDTSDDIHSFSGSLRVTGSGDHYFTDGNVGIGTSAPNAALHIGPTSLVSGYTPDRATLAISDTTNGGQLIIRGQSPRIWFDGTAGGNAELFLDDSKLNILSGRPGSIGSSRLYIKADGNVGIGTTSPGTKLHVGTGSGATVDPGYQAVIDSAGIAGLQILSATNQSGRVVFGDSDDNDIGMIKYDHTDNSMGFRTNGSGNERMRINSSGYVGIGTPSPLSPLHVASISSGPAARFINTSGTGGSGVIIQGGNSTSSNILVLSDYLNNERLRVRGDGNVGIGTTSPGAKLHIADTNKAINTEGNLFVATTDAYAIDKGGQISLGGVWHSSPSTTEFAAIAGRKQTTVDGNAGGYLQLSTSNSSGGALTEKMRIEAGGNVGIGTTSPSEKLEVTGVINASGSYLQATNDAADSVGLRLSSPTSGVNVDFEFEVGDTGISGLHSKNLVIRGSSATSDIAFSPSTAYPGLLMLDGSTGNVGIGTTTPNQKLHVLGNLELQSGFQIGSEDGNYYQRILTEDDTSENANTFQFQVRKGVGTSYGSLLTLIQSGKVQLPAYGSGTFTGTAAYTLAVDSSGNIIETDGGSGTVSTITSGSDTRVAYFNGTDSLEGSANFTWDDNKLQLNKSTIGEYLRVGSGGIRELKFSSYNTTSDHAGHKIDASSSNGEIALATGGTARMYIGSTGNVGIGGTPSASKKLYVNGTAQFAGEVFFTHFDNISGSSRMRDNLPLYFGTNRKFGIKYDSTADQMQFISGSSVNMVIEPNGNVGIGTTNPQYATLQVSGTGLFSSNVQIQGSLLLRDTTQHLNHDSTGFVTTLTRYTGGSELGLDYDYVRSINANNGGNVGIGTTAPTSKLELSEQLSAAGTVDYPLTISSRDDNNTINQTGGEGVGIKFRIAGNDTSTPGDSLVGASIAAIRESSSDTASMTALSFNVSQDDEVLDEVVRITSTGNVGIGETSPTHKLEVIGDSNDTMRVYRPGNRTVLNIDADSGRTSALAIDIAGTTQYYVGMPTQAVSGLGARFAISYQGDPSFVLEGSTGKVGIGVATPDEKIHIHQGNIILSGSSSHEYKAFPSSNQYASSIKFGNNELAYLWGGGVKAYFSSNSELSFGDRDPSNNGVNKAVRDPRIGKTATTNNTGSFYIKTADIARIFVSGSGDVGIGTSTPGYKLDIDLDDVNDRINITAGGTQKAIINGYGNIIAYGTLTAYGNTLGGGGGTFNYRGGVTNAAIGHRFMHVNNGSFEASSGEQIMMEVVPTINQSSTAGYTGIKLNVTETATGSGDKNLLDLQVGGVSKYKVNSDGDITMSGDLTVDGKVTAQEFHTEFVSASIMYDSGSTKFGDTSDDSHDFTGSLNVAGDVKINSNYPSHVVANDLTIGNTTTGDHGLSIVTSNTNTAAIYFGDNNHNDAGRIRYQHSNNAMRFDTNRAEAMRIDSSGNVGIGETDVDARLHISALASNGISNVKLESPGASKWAFGIPASQTYFALDDVNDNLTTPKLVVLKTSGNVGIGITSPTAKLHVVGDGLVTGELTFKPKAYSSTDDLNNDNRSIFSTHSVNNTTSNRAVNYSSIFTLGGSVSNALQISTNEDYNESGMWIRQYNQNGASPQGTGWQNWTEVWTTNHAPLSKITNWDTAYTYSQVGHLPLSAGASQTLTGDLYTENSIVFNSTTGNTINSIVNLTLNADSDQNSGDAYRNIIFQNRGAEKMRIDAAGNVGIGEIDPDGKLHIHQTGSGTLNTIITEDDARKLFIGRDAINCKDLNNNNAILYLNQSGGNVSVPNSSLGIGTTSPGANLEIRKSASDGIGPVLRLRADDSNDGNPEIQLYRGSGGAVGSRIYLENANTDLHIDNLYDGSSTYGRIFFRTQTVGTPINAMTIMPEGNVGIGTTSPSAKLDIEGDLQVKGVNISNQENLDVDTGTETIATVVKANYDAAFFDFVIKNGTNLRAGTVFAIHDGTNVEFTETSTNDLGDTSDVTLTVDISGTDMRLRATTTTDNWIIKSLVRTI